MQHQLLQMLLNGEVYVRTLRFMQLTSPLPVTLTSSRIIADSQQCSGPSNLPSVDSTFADSTKVIIDWSNFEKNVERNYEDHDMDTLINWVKSHPRRSNIHVYLRQTNTSRPLQRSLQTLGCTVIARVNVGRRALPALSRTAAREWR